MAGAREVTLFSPSIVFRDKTKPKLLFTSALYNDREKTLNNERVVYAWDEKDIQLNWALLNYSNPLRNMYYYKLDELDKDWHFVGNKGTVTFNSLEPGKYVFRYKASTADGIMSEEKIIRLIVSPPFWKNWWFIFATTVIILFLFYNVVRYISQRNLKERVLKLEKEQAIEKERNRISRDMHDELGSGLTKIAILTEVIKTQPDNNTHINKISETARGLVDNLDEMVWALNPRNDSLDKLIAYIAEYAGEYFENTSINCLVNLPPQITNQFIGEEKRRNIFMIVKEFLNNTLKHSKAQNLTIHFTQSTGVSSTGNGLGNMLQRIKDSGGVADLSSGSEGTHLKMTFTNNT
jgi:hypothetical protein